MQDSVKHMERKNRDYHILIIYDIVQDRRRTKFAEFLNGYGYRIQKSCFEAVISKKLYKKMKKEVPRFLDREEDSIRIYRLTDSCSISHYGIPCATNAKRYEIL